MNNSKAIGEELEHYMERTGVLSRELADLKRLVRNYRRCLFKPYNPVEVDNDEFYEYDRQIEQAVKEE